MCMWLCARAFVEARGWPWVLFPGHHTLVCFILRQGFSWAWNSPTGWPLRPAFLSGLEIASMHHCTGNRGFEELNSGQVCNVGALLPDIFAQSQLSMSLTVLDISLTVRLGNEDSSYVAFL